jgi:phage-related protein
VSGWWNDTILPFITGIVTKVAEFGAKIWNWIYDKISAVWTTVSDFFTKTIFPFVGGIVKNVKDKAGAIWDFISGTISGVWAKVTGFFTNTIYPFISGIGANIAKFAKGMWDGLKNGLESVVNFIIRGVNLIIKGINLLIRAANRVKIGSDIKEISEILPVNFAKGGIVPATPGGMLARIGEAGRAERVEPLDPDGLSKRDKAMIQMLSGGAGGGTTINVYPSQGMNESELAEIVSRKIAFAMRKGAA